MKDKSAAHLLRRFLKQWLEKLDHAESLSARAQPRPWYHIEYHLHPVVVAVVSSVVLFFTLWYGTEATIHQAIALGVFVVILVTLFSFYMVHDHPHLAKNDDAMGLLAVIFLSTLFLIKLVATLTPKVFWLSPYMTPVAIAPLLITLLLHPRLAVVMTFCMAMLFGFMNGFSLEMAIVASAGGVTVVAFAMKARTAHHVARSCFFVGIVQFLMLLFIAIFQSWSLHLSWIPLSSAFLSGILTAFFSLGALPYLESFFSRVSNIRLLELADVNHPLLKQMSIEAPGTYHHSLIVAALAEDAAEEIRANGLLCRVGAYFHDIGKMVKAEYFIENQGSLGNPHDQVSPSLSKLIITSHVKEGIALARTNNIDQQVADFIPQHHGTSKIEFFYRKALSLEEKEEETEQEDIQEEEYRYPGPKPQSKESGIVMMADSVEAAARTIEEPNHQRYKDLVYKIINKKLFDGQLDETALTLKDLHAIAERFTLTLQSVHHNRIPYPEALQSDEHTDDEKLTPPDQG